MRLKESIITLVLKYTICSVRLNKYVSIMRLIETKAIVLLIESIGAWLIKGNSSGFGLIETIESVTHAVEGRLI